MLAKAKKNIKSVETVLIKQSKKLPDELYKSLTLDRGKELADHQRFTLETVVDVLFEIPEVHGNAVQMRTLIDCETVSSLNGGACAIGLDYHVHGMV